MATKSPLAPPSASTSLNHGQRRPTDWPGSATLSPNADRNSGYFPHQQSPSLVEDQTLSNTLANSHTLPTQPARSPSSGNPLALAGSQSQGRFTEEWDASQRGSSIIDGPTSATMHRSNSFSSSAGEDHLSLPSRGNTLKKKSSLRRSGSLKRSGSRRSMKAGSVRSLALQSTSDPDEIHSVFHCPVPTTGNPTEALSNRFQSWRKVLKDLIAYYREIQVHYEHRSKSLLKLANVANNISTPPGLLSPGGIDDALQILRAYNKQAILEANKAREIEEDVVLALTGLRSDLQLKIKEIRNLSGDFKNSVEKEMDATRRAVKALQDVLGQSELDPSLATGRQDPYLLRLAVDRQVERQIDEENYLHQAYLNLENSGRELESIVVGEIQKAYNAYAGILKREADAAYGAVEELRTGPIAIPKDQEWTHFVQKDDQFVDPNIPIRTAEHLHYPGRDHVASQEIRAGLLERKSKYLKSYTAGWYVLSPTHLHEFKSADKAQAPVMSLYLPEQKLGSHSTEGGSSNKFILKGRQTGSMHRGHTWVFRAESHDTMMAWYEDIKILTERTPQERNEFVRGHSRSISQSSHRSASSDGVVDDEDEEPFAADAAVSINSGSKQDLRRPQPGGRFPSDIQVNAQRGLQAPLSPSSVSSGFVGNSDHEAMAAASALPGSGVGVHPRPEEYHQGYGGTSQTPMDEVPSRAAIINQQAQDDRVNPYTSEPLSRAQSAEYGFGSPPIPVVARAQSQQHGPPTPGSKVEEDWNARLPNGAPDSAQSSDARLNGTYEMSGGRSVENSIHHAASGVDTGAAAIPLASGKAAEPRVMAAPATDKTGRPIAGTVRTDSVPTISHLHVPGEFPKGTPTLEEVARQA